MSPETVTVAKPYHVASGEGLADVWWKSGRITVKTAGAETGNAFSQIETDDPRDSGPPLHLHHNEDETFYVLEGTPTFRLGDDTIVAGPGDFVNVPKGTPHCFRNASDAPVRMILTFTPSGIEKFFEETLERAYDLSQPCPDNLDEVGARYAAAAPRYGLEFFLDA